MTTTKAPNAAVLAAMAQTPGYEHGRSDPSRAERLIAAAAAWHSIANGDTGATPSERASAANLAAYCLRRAAKHETPRAA